MSRRRAGIACAALAAVLFGSAPAARAATTQLGDLSAPMTFCTGQTLIIQTAAPYTVPAAGVIDSLSFVGGVSNLGNAGAAPVVLRPAGGIYTVVGAAPTTVLTSPNQRVQDTGLNIRVEPGDLLGLWVYGGYECRGPVVVGAGADTAETMSMLVAPQVGLHYASGSPTSGVRTSLGATLTPDPVASPAPTPVATPAATASPPPPVATPAPGLSVARARIAGTFRRSRLSGHVRLVLSGRAGQATRIAVTLTGPRRPAAKRRTVALGVHPVPAGAFSLTVPLPGRLAARLLPGPYAAKLSGAGFQATATFALAGPPEGVVMTQRISTTRSGPGLLAVTRAHELWARFAFAPAAPPRSRPVARWYAPRRRAAVGTFPVGRRAAFSYWRNPAGLAKGRWRCVLFSGGRPVAAVALRVG